MAHTHQHACGRAVLRGTGSERDVGLPTFAHLESQFPLRLLNPFAAGRTATRTAAGVPGVPPKGVAVLYVVSFGGGLVSGDEIMLEIDVGEGTRLVMLTQGNTKVYRERRGGDPFASVLRSSGPGPPSRQFSRYIVRPNATLLLLPDPVTCFARSRYEQTQLIDLRCAETSSLVLLDWFNSGRLAADGPRDPSDADRIPELWHFYLYHSRNEVRVAGNDLARDRVYLEQELPETLVPGEITDIAHRCEPYRCYALLLLYGPECAPLITALQREFHAIQQRQPLLRSGGARVNVLTDDVLWGLSVLTGGGGIGGSGDGGGDAAGNAGGTPDTPGGAATPSTSPTTGAPPPPATPVPPVVVRIAGVDVSAVRTFLHVRLQPLCVLVGDDMYRMVMG
ncbi:hypothetical protein MSPP1_000633 [Malassezia sp. CBS 17886]|nr:hypothetical protein MSPP1_000633 [Malassezia sp. CBS 17886]